MAARSVAQYVYVGAIDEYPATPSTRCFSDDAEFPKLVQSRVDGRHGQSASLHCRGRGQIGACAHGFVDLEDRSRTFSLSYDAFAVAVE